ncbi:MAG: hypothetical protein F3742_10815 [Nitrospinae bacterium]|nr:hypothetical protein [Nitrospinota bacterium]
MPPTTLEGLFSSPSFLTVFFAFLLTIANVMVGVSMLPSDNRKKRYLLHRIVYGAVIVSFILFLVQKHFESKNSILNYTVFAYLLLVVPLSRRLNVTLHAVISSIALVLTGLVCFTNLF